MVHHRQCNEEAGRNLTLAKKWGEGMTDRFRVIRQVACVIKVIDQSLKDWIDFLGAGPFHTFECSQMDD